MGNLYSEIPTRIPDELVSILAESQEVRIERIVSRGHVSPGDFWYDQKTTEFVILVQGEAKLEFEDKKDVICMKSGDYLLIPPHARHRVAWTLPGEDTIWLAVHY